MDRLGIPSVLCGGVFQWSRLSDTSPPDGGRCVECRLELLLQMGVGV